jgi:CRISPR-associated protein (TIGR03986 family)
MAKDKAGKEVPEHDHSEGKRLAYRRVISLARYEADNKAAGSPGVLVLTGHPNTKKHMDFVFVQPDPNAAWHDVDEAVIRRFLQLHDAEDGDWASWWKPRLRQGANVPVFYLEDEGGGVSAIGLSQLFRLPGPQTIGELVRGQQQQDDPRLDFVENLFGRIAGEDSALKGRVAFGDARLVDARQASQVLAGAAYQAETVLAQPKPSFALNYLEQDRKARGASTILDPNARVRGWKRYPVRPLAEVELVEPPKAGQPSNSRLQPLKEGLRFQAQVRLHNVMPEELGAIAWALTWGGQPQLRHALGMGKPFGFGQLEVEVLDAHIVANDAGAAAPDWRACMQAYAGYMQEQVRGWAATPQLRELQAMANPALPQARRDNLRPLSLNVGGANEFSQARNSWGARDGRNLVLEPYAGGTVKR